MHVEKNSTTYLRERQLMITVLRDYFKRGSQVILWVIISAFVVGLMPMAFRQVTGSSMWAVRVNGQEIGYQEFLMEQERQRERIMAFREQYGEYADWLLSLMGATDQKALAARALIRQELVNQFADKLGIHMSTDSVAKKMSDPTYVIQELGEVIPPQIVDPITGINPGMLRRYLKHFGLSTDLFERQIERVLLDKLIMEFAASTLYVPLFDVKQKYQSEHAKKSFSLLSISLKDLIKKEKDNSVSDSDLKKYYDEQNSQFKKYWVPEKRSGIQWTFDPKAYNIAISDSDIEDYYQNNKLKKFIEKPSMVQVRRIVIAIPDATQYAAMQAKAARIKDEILQDPSQFKVIAQRVSDDKETAQNGGLVEPFSRGSHEQVFDRAAFLLSEDGAVSDVIETSKGLEILQRIKKTPQVFKVLSSVKNVIGDTLKQQQFSKKFAGAIKMVIDDEQSLAKFIADKGGKPKELKKVTSEGSAQLFKLKEGEKTFFVDGSEGIAIKLDKIHEPYLPSLEVIKSTVLDDYYEDNAKKKLQEKLKQAKKAMETTPLKDLQKLFDAEFIQTGWLDPANEQEVEKLKNKGLPTTEMLQMEKIGSVLTHADEQQGFVGRLDEIEPLDAQKFAEKQAATVHSLEQERTQQYLEGFIASLHRNAKIETNESVITLQS